MPLQPDPAVVSRGGINFTLCTQQALWYDGIGKALPMPQSVIDRLNAKVQGQPTYLVFRDCHGNAIRDIAVYVGHIETVEPNVELPGVHLPEVGESA